jgi:hypothetical protein
VTGEKLTGKDLEGISYGQIEVLSWYLSGVTEENYESSVRIAGVPVGVRNEYLPHYRWTNLLRKILERICRIIRRTLPVSVFHTTGVKATTTYCISRKIRQPHIFPSKNQKDFFFIKLNTSFNSEGLSENK